MTAESQNRLTAEMIAAGVGPSPASIWRFGHEVGCGYQKDVSTTRLITSLLPAQTAVVRRNGLFLGKLPYEAPIAREAQWSAYARNFGVMHMRVHHFTGSNDRIWLPDSQSGELHDFRLATHSPVSPNTPFIEWIDAAAYQSINRSDREYAKLQVAIQSNISSEELIAEARRKTGEAISGYDGPELNTREARVLESNAKASEAVVAIDHRQIAEQNDLHYKAMISEVLRLAEQEGEE